MSPRISFVLLYSDIHRLSMSMQKKVQINDKFFQGSGGLSLIRKNDLTKRLPVYYAESLLFIGLFL